MSPPRKKLARSAARVEALIRRQGIEQRTLIDLFPGLVFIKDPRNIIVRANRAAAESLGLSVARVEGRSTYELYPRLDADKYLRDDRAVIRSGKPKLGIVERYRTPDGELHWMQTDKVPYFDTNGEAIGVVVFAQDITERKRRADRQADYESGLRAIIEIADKLIACPDVDAIFREAVTAVRSRLGIERCAIFLEKGEVICGTYGTDMKGRTTDERKLSFPGDAGWREAFRQKDTRQLWKVLPDSPLYDFDGRRSRVVGRGWVACTPVAQPGSGPLALFCNDAAITEGPFDATKQDLLAVFCSTLATIIQRKRAEEAIRESENKFRAVCESTRAAIFLFQGPRLTYVNPAAEQISGYAADELYRMNFWDVIHPEHREMVRERGFARQKGKPVPVRYEVKILTKDGEAKWMDYTAGIVVIDGTPAVLGVAFDMTERKRTEEALRRRIASEQLTMRISTAVSNATAADLGECFRAAMNELMRFMDVDAASVIFLSDDRAALAEFYGAQRRGVPSVQKLVTGVAMNNAPVVMGRILQGDVFAISAVSDLPPEAEFARSICRKAHIESFLMVPVPIRGHVSGGLAVGCREKGRVWSHEETSLLRLVGELMGAARQRIQLEEEHARLVTALMGLQEDERKKISAILHDDLGQMLTLTRMELDGVRAGDADSARTVKRAAERVGMVLERVRNVAASLRPPLLDDLGVAAGLKTLCRDFHRRASYRVHCQIRGNGIALRESKATCLYRVLQEALTNTTRHVAAKNVWVRFSARKRLAVLEVRDDGRGFNVDVMSRRKGIGLIGMKERVQRCGGDLEIYSKPGSGMRLVVRVPL